MRTRDRCGRLVCGFQLVKDEYGRVDRGVRADEGEGKQRGRAGSTLESETRRSAPCAAPEFFSIANSGNEQSRAGERRRTKGRAGWRRAMSTASLGQRSIEFDGDKQARWIWRLGRQAHPAVEAPSSSRSIRRSRSGNAATTPGWRVRCRIGYCRAPWLHCVAHRVERARPMPSSRFSGSEAGWES
jgi:hypothetical protein